jgi:uncharacterized membrane protein
MSVDVAPYPVTDVEPREDYDRGPDRPALWPHVAAACLGAWLATAPAAVHPHPAALAWSDVVSGTLIIVLSGLACVPRFGWAAWALAGVGLWLTVAPLVFWAPTAAAYETNTLIGTLVFVFAVLVPGSRGLRDQPGPDVPPGWSYNPSEWSQRAGIIALALVQFFAARPMAAHQLGHVPTAWDPVFGDGTYRVLNSDVSKAFPVSDAGLGAVTYLIEALTGLLGGTRRWRTAPWAVLLFGVLVVPVGVVSIVLVVLQPLAVGAWCFLCLFTAITTVFMVAPAADEVVATGQFLLRARRQGRPFWRTFWLGGPAPSWDEPPVARKSLARRLADGMELSLIPWNLAVVAALGAWLMASPAVLGDTGAAAGSAQLVGALVVTFAVIGFGEPARAARWVCIPLGVWLLVAPWVLSGDTSPGRWNAIAVGVAILLLSPRRGHVEGRFGGWDRYVV